MISKPKGISKHLLDEKTVSRFWEKVDISSDDACWEWNASYAKRGGYGQFMTSTNNKRTLIKAHRFAYFIANPDSDMDGLVCHKCDNPKCCNPSHLYLGDYKTNSQDSVRRGRAKHCVMTSELAPARKLSWKDVENIRTSSLRVKELVALYGVSAQTIWCIRKGKTWNRPNMKIMTS